MSTPSAIPLQQSGVDLAWFVAFLVGDSEERGDGAPPIRDAPPERRAQVAATGDLPIVNAHRPLTKPRTRIRAGRKHGTVPVEESGVWRGAMVAVWTGSESQPAT